MFIEHVTARRFGCLNAEMSLAPDKVNLIIASNEAGKSTLVAAILAAFYGLVEDRRRTNDLRPNQHLFEPWDNTEGYQVTVDFTMRNVPWRLERNFRNGQSRLIDRHSGRDHSETHHRGKGKYAFGDDLFALDFNQFIRSFYIRQDEIALAAQDAAPLTHPIQKMVTSSKGESTASVAIQRLKRSLETYPPPWGGPGRTVDYVVKTLKQDYQESRLVLDNLLRGRQSVQEELEELSRLEGRIANLRMEKLKLEQAADVSEFINLKRALAEDERRRGQLADLEAHQASLEKFRTFPSQRADELNNHLWSLEDTAKRIQDAKSKLEWMQREVKDLKDKRAALSHIPELTEANMEEINDAVLVIRDRYERVAAAEKLVNDRREEFKTQAEEVNYEDLRQTLLVMDEEERRFVSEYRAAHSELELQLRDAMEISQTAELAAVEAASKRSSTLSLARVVSLIGIAALFTSVAMVFLTRGDWISQFLGVAGIFCLLFAGVAYLLSKPGKGRASLQIDAEWQSALDDEKSLRERIAQHESRLELIAVNTGHLCGADLLESFQSYSRLEMNFEPVLRHLDAVRQDHQDALADLQKLLGRLGLPVTDANQQPIALQGLLSDVRQTLKFNQDAKALYERIETAEGEVGTLENQNKERWQKVTDIMHSAGEEMPAEPMEARRIFEEGRSNRLKLLDVDREIALLKNDLLDERELVKFKERMELLGGRTVGQGIGDELTPIDVRDRNSQISNELEKAYRERDDLRVKIGSHYDRFQKEAPATAEKCRELQRQILTAETYRSEVALAIDILTEISESIYRSWAETLSNGASPILHSLNPRYDELRFSDDLSFTVKDNLTGRIVESELVEKSLSSGARDEIYLSVRLAMAVFLTRGAAEPLPIVMDEPLSAADDRKFLTGMSYFMETLSQKHQVIILSCHEQRHEWLKHNAPELFAERVNIVKLQEAV